MFAAFTISQVILINCESFVKKSYCPEFQNLKIENLSNTLQILAGILTILVSN